MVDFRGIHAFLDVIGFVETELLMPEALQRELEDMARERNVALPILLVQLFQEALEARRRRVVRARAVQLGRIFGYMRRNGVALEDLRRASGAGADPDRFVRLVLRWLGREGFTLGDVAAELDRRGGSLAPRLSSPGRVTPFRRRSKVSP